MYEPENRRLENPETAIGMEAYVVQKSATDISSAAKEYGKAVPDYPELLVYSEDETGNTMYIIGYELFRYKTLNHFPLSEDDTIRSIAAVGAEMYPGYFGGFPVPFLTPWAVPPQAWRRAPIWKCPPPEASPTWSWWKR